MATQPKKVKIHEFDPVLYPCRLWIAVNPTFDEVSEKFYQLNSNVERCDFDHEYFDPSHHIIARTYPVSIKGEGWMGLLIGIYKEKQCNVGTIAHEAAHSSDWICEQFGITTGSFENGEAYAYLVGWIAECIWKVKTGKL
jgi:hypothetical protein